ncbi:hypothetical protein A1O3_06474 [Capronia epimyces CBS 606.96]|uniref:DNA replication complex GINS protein SLD5 n=1 Tax=Capronia epimyces CBS 606.96 TaxID=1182542 RepID=W9XZ54_9EURO|nr:uncharacterized protein A1O3_06474 [Capronia epimyces CBS 606.96]EXJ82660.1 hypothetical protein A1O3_06474 [Capronia epimyces CBS 606.96]
MDMDMDIADILAEVSRPPDAGSRGQADAFSDTDAFTDHQLLTRAWTCERCAPDLLPYPCDLMNRVMARVQSQVSRIEDLASSGGGDSGTGAPASHALNNGYGHPHPRPHSHKAPSGTQNTNLILSILQTDLSRTQFLVRSFLRQRLAKLTKHAGWYLAQLRLQAQRQDAGAAGSMSTHYLSAAETQFLRAHQALLSDFYSSSFLSAFPPALRRLDDATGGVPMLEPPDAAIAVVVRCLVDGVWSNERDVDLAPTAGSETGEWEREPATVELRMRHGEVWLVRWRDVRGGVERGELELL